MADTLVGAVTRRLREGNKGTNVAGVVLVCAFALVGIFFIVVSVSLYVDNRDLAAHGVRTQGEVVWADAEGSDLVFYTVGGTDYEVPGAGVGDRLPGEAVTVVYDPRDPAISNLEDDSFAWRLHWVFLGLGLFVMAIPALPVVVGVFEADGPVGRRLARARPARRQLGTPPTPPGPSDREPLPARQALPEPYVPGSGKRVPAELRLVLAGYVGIAGGLFATALACATAAVFFFFGDLNYLDGDRIAQLSALFVCICAALCRRFRRSGRSRRVTGFRGCSGGPAIHTATVMASKRGGRTLILDLPWYGTGRGYQPLSEVHLASWMKAGMLLPGEPVTVYGGPGGEYPLLISSAQRGRAFLGAMKGRSTVQPGPIPPLDEKVSGATLVEWAAWAASTTFSSTGLRFGYDKREVDAFRSAVRDTFLRLSGPAVKSDDVHGKQFSTHRRGYDKKQVAAFIEAAGLRLAAMESTDRPAGPLVSGAICRVGRVGRLNEIFNQPSEGRPL